MKDTVMSEMITTGLGMLIHVLALSLLVVSIIIFYPLDKPEEFFKLIIVFGSMAGSMIVSPFITGEVYDTRKRRSDYGAEFIFWCLLASVLFSIVLIKIYLAWSVNILLMFAISIVAGIIVSYLTPTIFLIVILFILYAYSAMSFLFPRIRSDLNDAYYN